jgi:molybdopterin-containing oxidoreductase family molybdopterin binding subunit
MFNPAVQSDAVDDVWIPSTCSLCYGTCSILAHRVNGVVIKIEGNPESAVGKGRLCGKGVSGLMTHYDPHRVRTPLRRTNPAKGLGVDPGWREISWDDALDEVADRLRKLREDDPRKLFIQRTTTVTSSRTPIQVFAAAFGTPNRSSAGGGLHCGNGAHLISGIMHASWSVVPDFQYCNYAVYFGASKGHAAGHASCSNMGMAADARGRGMKMVVVDPMCNFAAAKATEWVPIRVGTDAALALAMCHVMVNELGIYDIPYLQAKTNAPYLIGPDKLYVRDPQNNEPLVWDVEAKKAVPYHLAKSQNLALEGEFQINAVACRPAFVLLKDHLKQFTPDWAADITTLPAKTIRRLGNEFATEARVGSTIVIDGVTVPYRPVAAIAFRGSQGHINSVYNFLAVDLLNQLVGSADMVGGCLGFNPASHGYPETGRPSYVPKAGPDGLMVTGSWMAHHVPYPIRDPRMPEEIGLQDLFSLCQTSPFSDSADREEMWEKFELPYRPEILLNYGTNSLMSIGNKATVASALADYKFIVSFDLFLTESSAFADIILPDCSYLESYDSRPNFPFIFSLPGGMGEWCWPIKQPVVEPDKQQRRCSEILIELADRIGMREDLNAAYNAILKLEGPYRLQTDRRYTYEEVCDAELKTNFGAERGLEWFKKNGVLKWRKKPEEVYWRHFVDVRVPIYWEFLPALGKKIKAIAEPRGLKIPGEFYEPLPDWISCPSHSATAAGFDFYAFYYRDIIHTNSFTMENPWLDEAARLDPYSYTVAINTEAARRKGLKDGEVVWVETKTGRKVKGKLHLTEAIHPEGLGIAACAGHWGKGMPIAEGKGVFFNDLLEIDFDHVSPVNLNLDLCVRVKVSREV